MTEASLNLGNGNWAGKSGNLLAYHKANNNFYADDLTFARASTGTYTDKDGYIQEMPYNLLTYSEQFDNADWVKQQSTITADATTSPNGTTSADKLIESTSSSRHTTYQQLNGSYNNTYSCSVFVKKAERKYISLSLLTLGTTSNFRAIFDVESGIVTDSYADTVNGATISTSISDFGDGWYRCAIIGILSNTGSGDFFLQTSLSDRATYSGGTLDSIYPSYTGNGTSGIYIYGAQINKGTSAKTYFPTTTRLNVPRVDYLNNSNGSLILEPQRSNLVPYSSDFSNAAWLKTSGVTVTSNYGISPDGKQNSTRLQFASNNEQVYDGIVHSGNTETASIYVKGQSGITMQFGVGSNISQGSTYTLTGEWQRLEHQSTSGSLFIIGNKDLTATDIEIYGAQLEQGSYPTSLIPTTGTTVTRLADASATTGLSDVIGQTEGTIYGEFNFKDHSTGTRRLLCLTDGSSSNRITTYLNTLNKLSVYIVNGGAAQADIQATILTEGIIKYAVAYANNSIKLYLNGTQVGTDTSATIPSTTDLYVGSENGNNPSFFDWNQVTLFDQALTDTELATLTT